ncbi:MAG: beta strand repeat-containing protein, partial [Spirochaetia bacterium]
MIKRVPLILLLLSLFACSPGMVEPELIPNRTGTQEYTRNDIVISADETVEAPEVILRSAGTITVRGTIRAETIVLRGRKVVLEGAVLDASGKSGGDILIGSPEDTEIILIDADTEINADAEVSGSGGRVLLRARTFLDLDCRISARGGPEGGDGGFIETSSFGRLELPGGFFADASAPAGKGGTWLIDPTDITIQNAAGDIDGDGPDYDTADFTLAAHTISTGDIESHLNTGTSVVIDTSSALGGTGNIIFDNNAAIDKTGGADAALTLDADGSVSFANGADITSTSGALTVSITALGSIDLTDAGITTNGGAVTLTADNGISLPNNTSDITTAGGNFSADADADTDGAGTFSSGAGSVIDTGGGTANIGAAAVALAGTVNTGAGNTYLYPSAAGTAVSIGGASGFDLDQTELTNITANSITVGEDSAAAVTAGTVDICSAGGVDIGAADLTVSGTGISFGGNTLTTTGNLDLTAETGAIAGNAAAGTDAAAAALTLSAATGIGGVNPVETTVNSLSGSVTGTGNIGIAETDAVTVNNLTAADGGVSVTAGGTITVSGG